MDLVLRLFSLVCAGFTMLLVVVMLFTFRKPRRIGRFTPLLSALLSLLVLGLFWWISGAHLNRWVAWPLFGLGLLVGLVAGGTARLYRQGDVAFLSFIRDLQAFNYSLAEIATIVRLVGPDPGAAEAGLEGMPAGEVEKAASALEFLVGRMQEVREASLRVEAVFSRRLRAVLRRLRAGKRGP